MEFSEQDRAELLAAIKSDAYDGSVSSRAQIVLWYGEGRRKSEIAAVLKTTRPTVDKWIERYEKYGIEGLVNRTSPGGPRQTPDRIRSRVLALTRETPPSALGISHWSSAEMSRYIKMTEGVYVSTSWVCQLWRENGLTPWRQGTFKISRDPDFEDKVRDVVGLYLSPPDGEVVVSVDVKTGIQALDRTQPLLPVTFGKTEKRTHDYVRAGTIDLYAAIDIRTGKVIPSLSPTHAAPDFLRLMKKVVATYPGKKVHVVLDNATVHTSAETARWLDKQKDGVVFHFTPTSASWVNQIEIWNGVITRKVIRRGTHSSVKLLIKDIESFVVNWNSDSVPIKWTATADEIIDNVRSITSHMERLVRASEIDDVIRQAA
ncbi:MAG: IS630 family transposase [Chloroflexi bacterium]|nr:IS630 family transposase [Acidobacteriota bacterium]MCA1587941.1 IS630 family transposase [Chloroflexota bacterium]MCA1705996.1 IS630 family transposase [Actinomycetota bacterium]